MPPLRPDRNFLVRAGLAVLFAVCLCPALHAQRWTSDDRFLSVNPPDATKYPAQPSPIPDVILAFWESPDESTKFEVFRAPLPPGVVITQESSEKSWAGAVDGAVRRLPTKQIEGFDVWRLHADGRDVALTQALVLTDDASYALRVSSLGAHADEDEVMRFLDSLTINPSALAPKAAPAPAAPAKRNPFWLLGFAVVLLIVGWMLRSNRGAKPRRKSV